MGDMLTRYVIAAVLWVCWLLLFIPKAAGPREKAVVKDSSARWGMIIQGVAYGVVFSTRNFDVPAWRVPIGILLGATGILTSYFAIRHLAKLWRFDAALSENHTL